MFSPSNVLFIWPDPQMITHLSLPRKYTTTHNDDRREIYVSVGHIFNQRLLDTDEVRNVESQVNGEWNNGRIILEAIVSSDKNPEAEVRDLIIRREMPSVLKSIGIAEKALCSIHPELRRTKIYVRYISHIEKYNKVEYYGLLKDYLPKNKRGD